MFQGHERCRYKPYPKPNYITLHLGLLHQYRCQWAPKCVEIKLHLSLSVPKRKTPNVCILTYIPLNPNLNNGHSDLWHTFFTLCVMYMYHADCFEHGNKPSGSTKLRVCLEWMCDYDMISFLCKALLHELFRQSIYLPSHTYCHCISKKLQTLSIICICSFGYFPGVSLRSADVSEPSVGSIFKGCM